MSEPSNGHVPDAEVAETREQTVVVDDVHLNYRIIGKGRRGGGAGGVHHV